MILVFWCVPHAWSKGSDLFAWYIKYIIYLYTCSDIFTTSTREVCCGGHVHNCCKYKCSREYAELDLMSMIHTVNYVRYSNFPFLKGNEHQKSILQWSISWFLLVLFLLSCKLQLHFYVPALLQGNHQNWAPIFPRRTMLTL